LVEPTEFAAEFAQTSLVVEGTHSAKRAVSLRGDLTTRLAAHTVTGVPHALVVTNTVGLSDVITNGVTEGSVPLAEVITRAHFSDVERRNTRNLGITIAAVAARASKRVPVARRLGIAGKLRVESVLAALLANAQSPFAH
jgi:hypothetical protein